MWIIIPSNNPVLAEICLRSITERDPRFLAQTVIVTNEPDDFSSLPVVVVGVPAEFNFAAWVNAGITINPDAASYLLLNDDTELLTDNGFSLLEAVVENPASPGILSAAIRGTGGVIDQRQATPSSVRLMPGHISFTAAAIRRDVVDRLGFLDERFVGYGYEDNDYCQRAIDAGIAIAVYDGCVVAHRKPHSTFARRKDFNDLWTLGETLFFEKWSGGQEAVVVIGGMRSGAAVVSAVVEKMGYDMPDPPASFEKKVSVYYRDDRLSRLVKRGEVGIRNYIAGRNYRAKDKWGTRLWPQPEAAIALLERLSAQPLKVVFVEREREARIASYVADTGMKHMDATKRIDAEIDGQAKIREWVEARGIPARTLSYSDLVMPGNTGSELLELALFLGYEKSLALARDVVRPEYNTFAWDGSLIIRDAPQDFGKVAVGVRLFHPEGAFVGCLMRLLREGLREGDTVLEPALRMPSHWAASTLMRRFLASDADTLLLVDDDMTFPPTLLSTMRDNEENWRHGIVSALATQRIPPPRALVMRVGEQPPLPDALNGLYYDLLVNEVRDGETLPVDGTGFAFTLIRREVIEAMTDAEYGPNFTYYVQWGAGGEGEDVNFSRRAGSLGFSVAVDAAAHVGHIGAVVYGYEEFQQWRGGQVGTGLRADRLLDMVQEALPYLGEASRDIAVRLLQSTRE
jgi:GT2 family glycosyltransferase